MKKNTNKQKFSLRTLFQNIFISSDLFVANTLSQNASSCAFGFLFSLLPVILMILMILTRILHTNQDILTTFYPYLSNIITQEQFETITSTLLDIKKIGIFEVITVLVIFWISRRFFINVMQGFHKIFRNHTNRKNLFFTLGGFLGEVILIVGVSVITALVVTITPFFRTNHFFVIFPELETRLFQILVFIMPYALLFLAVFFTYRFAPGTKPKLRLCFWASLSTTGVFFVVQKALKIFLNISRYNLIYGVLSNLIVLLLEVHIFFQIFLFFAQYIYVSQFFETLLLGELYLLPKKEDPAFFARIKRFLFIKPSKLINKIENVIHIKKDENIYEMGSFGTDVYYIVSGIAEITKKNRMDFAEPGSFIGEVSAFLDIPREATVIAKTDLQLIRIKEDVFQDLLRSNPEVTMRLLENVAKINLE